MYHDDGVKPNGLTVLLLGHRVGVTKWSVRPRKAMQQTITQKTGFASLILKLQHAKNVIHLFLSAKRFSQNR